MAEARPIKTITSATVLFFIVFFCLYAIYQWSEPYIIHYFNWLASSVCATVSLYDPAVHCKGNLIYYGSRASLKVIEGCDGITVFILIIAAVSAFPKPLKERFLGILVLIPILFVLNWLRLLILALIQFYTPDYFGAVHVYLFQPVMVFATFICFIIWITRDTKSSDSRAN